MAVTLIAGIASAAMAYGSTVAAGAAFTFLNFTGFNAFLAYAFASTAMGLALQALAPKPKVSGANRGYQVNSRGSALDHQIIYGKMRVGGVILYDQSTGVNNKSFHRIIAFAGHEIESFEEVYLNDELVTIDSEGNVTSPEKYVKTITKLVQTGVDDEQNPIIESQTTTEYLAQVYEHFGAADQDADQKLVERSEGQWTQEHTLSGIAYLYVRFRFNSDAFPNGIPVVTATVKGKKVYDPNNGMTKWSDNPALCLRDYLTSTYGLNENAANIDDDLVRNAVIICNQQVQPRAGTTDPVTTRYTCNGAFTTALTPYDLLSDLLTCMGGSLWYAQGKWRMKPAYWTDPVMDLVDDDLRSGINVSTRHSRRNNFNTVKGTFRGEESNWQVTDYPQVTSEFFVETDGGQESVADVDLPFTDNSLEARRIALISLESNRQQLTINATFGLRTLELQVGDNVRITNTRFGWDNKEFLVVAWSFGLSEGADLQTNMTLRETAESVFDEVLDTVVYERDNTNLPSPFDVPVPNVSVGDEAEVSNEKISNVAIVAVTSEESEAIDHVEVQYKLTSQSTYSSGGQGDLGEFRIRDLKAAQAGEDPITYDFRVRAINTFGIKGSFSAVITKPINAFSGAPTTIGDDEFEHELSGGTLFISWVPVPDPDLSHYEIKHNSNFTGVEWSESTTVIRKVARPSTTATLPARAGTFLVKAVDKQGQYSENFASLQIQASELPPLDTSVTIDQDPAFSGVKTNTVVNSGNLEIDDSSGSNPSGEYYFDTVHDVDPVGGSSRNVRVTGERTFTRSFDNGTMLWDDIPQNWNTWPNNFDDWTNEDAAFGDVSVIVYVSVTTGDPTGSPTWGPYLPANGSVYVGRGFRFKAILSSTNANFTPSVSALSVTVEY